MHDAPKTTPRRTAPPLDSMRTLRALSVWPYPSSPCPIHFALFAKWVGNHKGRPYRSLRRLRWTHALSFVLAASALAAQTAPPASPANEPPTPPDQSPTFTTPPVAIVRWTKRFPAQPSMSQAHCKPGTVARTSPAAAAFLPARPRPRSRCRIEAHSAYAPQAR